MSDLTGPNQADTMLRRVSPEGRARARHEAQRRQRRTMKLVGQILLVALVLAALLGMDDAVTGAVQSWALMLAALLFVAASAVIVWTSREKPAVAAALGGAPLHALPGATAAWLEHHVAALPAPAATLAGGIATRLEGMTPQLAKLDAREPAGDAVRRLLSVELPGLIERYQSVPHSLRGQADEGGQSADAHLMRGLSIVDEEVTRMTAQLARGDLDLLATQDRFLELKYQGDEIGRA